jgi:hypothetical protein
MGKARACLLLLSAVLATASAGCVAGYPLFLVPVPQPAWVASRMEEKYGHDRDFKTPIMPPIREGYPPPLCEDPPSVQRVIRAMPKIVRGVPHIYEEFRDDIQVVTERIKDTIDPPRFFPLVGPAQLHHCHWKCTIYYTETLESSYPFPFKVKRPRIEVVYIDLDHLHLYPCGTPETRQSIGRDLIQN